MTDWKINRGGLQNFWYYDDEEFHFNDGRLLLRGANGSGKSVTMQSLVPLLFDGNKSPERLDPFGSRARRMENYLLSDGLNLEERTGYLFLEFAKEKTGRYLTIGMGMRARKNMAMDSWYFIIQDNRRLGENYDLSLYKDMGGRIPLSRRELTNRIGEGGQVFLRQKDYKAAVNDQLFGYADLSDFDELIELLLQIRSPKLSKEFKPTTLYDIMQNSLVTLTDHDLRPMSEAIENMDTIKLKIDGLKKTQRALGRIESAYKKYNAFVLVDKADRFLSEDRAAKKSKKEGARLAEKKREERDRYQALTDKIQAYKEEEKHLRDKEERLKAHDASRLVQEKTDLAQSLAEKEKTQQAKEDKKRGQLKKKKQTQADLKDLEDQAASNEASLRESLEDLAALSQAAGFEEDAFMQAEYLKEEKTYDFSHHSRQVKDYRDRLKALLKSLEKRDQAARIHDDKLLALDQASTAKEKEERRVRDYEKQLLETKEDWAQAAFSWAKSCKELSLEGPVLSQTVERIHHYRDLHSFSEATFPLDQAYQAQKGALLEEKSHLAGLARLDRTALADLEGQLKDLVSMKDPAPKRSPAVEKNRKRLVRLKIPHSPLYKALEGQPGLSDASLANLEEALEDLGILDALIVRPSDRDQVLKMDAGLADKYIFADPLVLSHNLGDFLLAGQAGPTEQAGPGGQAGQAPQAIGAETVRQVLESILTDPDQSRLYLSPKGRYGMGLIQGQSSRTKKARFLGPLARKAYRDRLVAEKKEEIDQARGALDQKEAQLDHLTKRAQLLQEDFDRLPKEDDLALAYQELVEEKLLLVRRKKEEEALRDETQAAYQALKVLEGQVIDLGRSIYLAKDRPTIEGGLLSMEDYQDAYQDFLGQAQRDRHFKERLGALREKEEEELLYLDELSYELDRLEEGLRQDRLRLRALEEELSLEDAQEVLIRLEACQTRLKEIPPAYQAAVQDHSQLAASLSLLEGQEQTLKADLKRLEDRVQLYGRVFGAERALGYVRDEGEKELGPAQAGTGEKPSSTRGQTSSLSSKLTALTEADLTELLKEAQQLRRLYGDLLVGEKTLMDYWSQLNDKFLKEQGELVEYNLKRKDLFKEIAGADLTLEEEKRQIQRIDIIASLQGRELSFYELMDNVRDQIDLQGSLLSEQDRKLFEDILINSVSKQISAKIYHSERWVEKIDALMSGMQTSMGMTFNLRWVTKKAEAEDQLSTRDLVTILKGDQSLLSAEQRERLIAHFRSKIDFSKSRLEDETDERSFLAIMKEILDYRQWFEFRLYFTKKNDKKKELTNRAFFTFSGGEKAMAMYVPLFSAVYAKYQGGRPDCPKVISLDEAFAGVDEKNIQDMFRLLVELDLSFIANSQVLYGDYATVPALNIYELIRPENVTFVTLIPYQWNGQVRSLMEN